MTLPSAYSSPQDREALWATTAFLNKRLAEQGTIDWALKLSPRQRIERIALVDLLNSPRARDLSEPWASAWRLIEESWSTPLSEVSNAVALYGIQKRLRAGDRSGGVVNAIVDLVKPRLEVEPIVARLGNDIRKRRAPRTVEQILSAGLTSGDLIDLEVLELEKLLDIGFLKSLANSLEAAVSYGLDTARRLGWNETRSFIGLGVLNRVYYTQATMRGREDSEPDAHHRGIAPSVKLLHAIVRRISELELAGTKIIVRRWKQNGSPVHVRLWAAMSRDELTTPIDEVSDFLAALNKDQCWDIHDFPEIAELRAVRFRDMDPEAQEAIAAWTQKGPPRKRWPRKVDATAVKNGQLFWSLRELRRIEVGGGALPARTKAWLDARLAQFPELAGMTLDEGFPRGVTVTRREAKPDPKFDTLSGIDRLRALESAFATGRRGWDDDPAERASDWINQPGNAERVLSDFETSNNGGDSFPRVWNRFGWAHRPHQQDGQTAQDANLIGEAARVVVLLNQLSDATLSSAIEGLCAWLDSWVKQAASSMLALPVWLRLWPIAVEVTNREREQSEDEDLIVTVRAVDDDREPMDLDTLNTPAGKLISVFLATCPTLTPDAHAFPAASMERQMRDTVMAANGRSALIAKHRMIEDLPYFLRADHDWAQEHLIAPLLEDNDAALALWRAVARRTHFTEALEIIGAGMAERANDLRLGRETRRRLVFSLVIECLHAFREGREPAVSNPRIQQMLRTLDDEVRASAANAIQQFVRELSAKAPINASEDGKEQEDPPSAAALFRTAAAPFLHKVWPQERSLATPGVSRALADLPASSGEAFGEAVETIARFMVPFECWSMIDYGLYDDEREAKKLAVINDKNKAQALLKLLDLTVGTPEGAVIPIDLTDALDQISSVAPELVETPVFRRLSASARR